MNLRELSPYAVTITKEHPFYKKFENVKDNREGNIIAALRFIEIQANRIFNNIGIIMLDDIYQELSVHDKPVEFIMVGWDKRKSCNDGYIDFNMDPKEVVEFMNGKSDRITLDFNVDGVI